MADLTLDPPQRPEGRRPLLLGTMGHAVNDAYTAFLPTLLPAFHLQLGMDAAALAGLVATFALSASLPGPFLGRLSDRFGEARVTAASVLFTAVLLSLMTIVPSIPLLFATVAVAGLGSAAIHPAGSVLVRQSTAGPELSVALFAAGGMLGYAAGPSLLTLARDLAGPALPLVLSLPGILAALAILILIPRETPGPSQAVTRFDWGLFFGPVGLMTMAAGLAFLPAMAVFNGLPIVLMERHGMSPTDAVLSATLSIFALAAAVGGIGVGFLTPRLGRRALLAAVLTASVPAFWALLWLAPDTAAFVMLLVAAGALASAATPILVVTVQDLAPRASGSAAGMVFGLGSALAALFYLGIGILQTLVGTVPAMSLAFAAPVLSAAIAVATLRRTSAMSEETLTERLCACAPACGAGICST